MGHASFKLKGKTATIVTDPYDAELVGFKYPKGTVADIVTISHSHTDHNNVKAIEGSPLVISGPGEYEAKGVDIQGVATWHDTSGGKDRGKNTVYRIDIDGISVVHLGDLGHKLTEEQEELLGDVDVLLIPVGGFYTIDAKTALEVVTQLEPTLVIPMHYRTAKHDQKTFSVISGVDQFLREMGKEGITPIAKIKVTKDSLPQETQVVILE